MGNWFCYDKISMDLIYVSTFNGIEFSSAKYTLEKMIIEIRLWKG